MRIPSGQNDYGPDGKAIVEQLSGLPIRTRISMALAAAVRAASCLTEDGEAKKTVRGALDEAWHWELTGEPEALKLYQWVLPLLECELLEEIKQDLRKRHAILSATYAIYYTIWHAARWELRNSSVKDHPSLPNDLAEVSEQELIYCLNSSSESAAFPTVERKWQLIMVTKLRDLCATQPSDLFGAVIEPAVFEEFK
jgi:hypothetical protein